MLAAVVFDLDDTLVDQRTAARQAVVGWAAELGHEIERSWADISRRHYVRYQRREIGFAEQRRARVREFLGVTVTDGEADELFGRYLVRYEAGWAAFDDALPTLQRVRAAGLPVAVLTNGEATQQRRKLERLGLAPQVDLLVASSDLPAGKPDRRAFEHTVRLLGVPAGQTLMVGDSLRDDVRGARTAGLPATLLDRAGRQAGEDVPRVRTLHELVF